MSTVEQVVTALLVAAWLVTVTLMGVWLGARISRRK